MAIDHHDVLMRDATISQQLAEFAIRHGFDAILSAEDIEEKYFANARLAVSEERAREIRRGAQTR